MMAPASSMTQIEVVSSETSSPTLMALLVHAFLRVAFDTAEVTGSPGERADALRLGHVPSLRSGSRRRSALEG